MFLISLRPVSFRFRFLVVILWFKLNFHYAMCGFLFPVAIIIHFNQVLILFNTRHSDNFR